MEQSNVVKEPLTPALPSNGTPPTVVPEETTPPAPAGSKTDSELLLKSLHEEREKRKLEAEKTKLLEEELELLKSSVPSENEVFSDEGKVLKKEISTLTEKINSIEEEKNLEKLYNQYPLLREKAEEFKEFRKAEHPRAKLESVVKLYLAENGLLEPVRKGLERPTGGPKIPPTSGMTAEDVKTLRQTNFKKYQEMLMKGQIKID